ncbi:copper chaperone PCu(A)C [Variovorax sp. RHLX14]|uniref:copper chaperone PCu(A)C n=1 Tax=Variovorax sp. RHLX14 TaxID=1259731 RepID=UPI003F447D50
MQSSTRHAFQSILLAVAALAAASAQAQVTVKDAWVRATVPQQKSTSAFMQISAAKDTKLVSVSTPVTPLAEVHEMAMRDGVMRMRQVAGGIELPAGKTVELTPSGQHIMLLDLPQQVKAGEKVPLTLVFEDKSGKRETQQVEATVRPLNSAAASGASGASMPGMHGDHKH